MKEVIDFWDYIGLLLFEVPYIFDLLNIIV